MRGAGTDEMRNRAEASDLRRCVFACPLSVCLDPEAISGSKAVRQIQRALPDGAGRAWRRVGLARRDGRHTCSTVRLGPRGRMVVQHDVPGDILATVLLQIRFDCHGDGAAVRTTGESGAERLMKHEPK